jgi:glycosyltransferase involved in cell wall biosynthesis
MPPTEPGLVSVVVPAYKAAPYVAQAIDCALGQSYPHKEVIVVDDGSPDNTAEVCAPYGDRIVFIRQENRGEAGARNRALEVARGEFISLLDADDVCAPQRLAVQVGALAGRPDAVACFCGHWVFGAGGEQGRYPGAPACADFGPADFLARLRVHPITMTFRRAAAAGLQFPAGVRTGGDMIFTALLRRGGPFVIVPDVLYGYRRHPQQVTAAEVAFESMRHRLDWLDRHGPAQCPEFDRRQVETAMWLGYAEALACHYWARRKADYHTLAAQLRQRWPADLPLPRELSLRWYPDWVWALKGWAGRLRAALDPRRVSRPTC